MGRKVLCKLNGLREIFQGNSDLLNPFRHSTENSEKQDDLRTLAPQIKTRPETKRA